jgi:hypothetical protein
MQSDIERAANIADITIFLPPSGPHTAEEISGYLYEQRRLIAERIRGLNLPSVPELKQESVALTDRSHLLNDDRIDDYTR